MVTSHITISIPNKRLLLSARRAPSPSSHWQLPWPWTLTPPKYRGSYRYKGEGGIGIGNGGTRRKCVRLNLPDRCVWKAFDDTNDDHRVVHYAYGTSTRYSVRTVPTARIDKPSSNPRFIHPATISPTRTCSDKRVIWNHSLHYTSLHTQPCRKQWQ